MESTNDVVQLLQEIRDTQREHLAEYKRISAELLALNTKADELYRDAAGQSKASVKVWNSLWSAITALIAICLGSLLIILQQVSAARSR